MQFVIGLATGITLTGGAIAAMLYIIGTRKLAVIDARITGHAEKLVMVRKRLGQIANRQSIGEARKIANIALKELSK